MAVDDSFKIDLLCERLGCKREQFAKKVDQLITKADKLQAQVALKNAVIEFHESKTGLVPGDKGSKLDQKYWPVYLSAEKCEKLDELLDTLLVGGCALVRPKPWWKFW